MTLFRVHYSLTGLSGVLRLHDDVAAPSPDAAAAILATRYKPKPVAIAKIKRVKEFAHG